MKKLIVWVVLMLWAQVAFGQVVRVPHSKNPYREYVEDCSNDRCKNVMITLLNEAGNSIVLQETDPWDQTMYNALFRALERKVNIAVILTPQTHFRDQYIYDVLVKYGLQVFIDKGHGRLSSVIVIDHNVIITGTVRDKTGIVVMHNPTIAGVYENEWMSHYEHSCCHD